MADVVIYQHACHRRSRIISNAMFEGIRKVGDNVSIKWAAEYAGPEADIGVFYGFMPPVSSVLTDYPRDGGAGVYIDLGYWGRHHKNRWAGYHKISVNARHPTAYFMNNRHSGQRASALGIAASPWKNHDRGAILLAGMGDKGAEAEGYRPEEWERAAIAEIRRHTDREIIYRPKPSWKEALPIDGTTYSPKLDDLDKVLRRTGVVVTHHSNVAVDALVFGIPAFCWDGVAKPLSLQDLSKIDDPLKPEGRTQWIADISYAQWSVEEMTLGAPWRHLKNEGLIP